MLRQRGVSSITQPQPAYSDGTPIGGAGRGNKFLPNTTDWLGRWRLAANAGNDWTIDREARMNSLSRETLRAFGRLAREAAENASIRAIVITGAGEKAFCTGIDRMEQMVDWVLTSR